MDCSNNVIFRDLSHLINLSPNRANTAHPTTAKIVDFISDFLWFSVVPGAAVSISIGLLTCNFSLLYATCAYAISAYVLKQLGMYLWGCNAEMTPGNAVKACENLITVRTFEQRGYQFDLSAIGHAAEVSNLAVVKHFVKQQQTLTDEKLHKLFFFTFLSRDNPKKYEPTIKYLLTLSENAPSILLDVVQKMGNEEVTKWLVSR